MFDPYQILGVSNRATAASIRKKFLGIAKKLHPDTGGPTADAEAFTRAHKAYAVLTSPAAREKYDTLGIVDGEPEGKRIAAAIQNLKSMFGQLVAQVPLQKLESSDLIGELNKQIVARRSELQKGQRDLRERIKQGEHTLQIMQKRIRKHKKNAPDILLDALRESLAGLPAQAQMLEENIVVGDIMLRLLEDFSYDFDRMQTAVRVMQSSSTFTITF